MHFRTYDHYPTCDTDIIYVPKVCFVCLDDELVDNIQPLKCYSYRLSLCECNMNIHRACLHNWYLHKNECPLCRKHSSLITVRPRSVDYICVFTFLAIKLFYILYYAYITMIVSYLFHIIIRPMYRS